MGLCNPIALFATWHFASLCKSCVQLLHFCLSCTLPAYRQCPVLIWQKAKQDSYTLDHHSRYNAKAIHIPQNLPEWFPTLNNKQNQHCKTSPWWEFGQSMSSASGCRTWECWKEREWQLPWEYCSKTLTDTAHSAHVTGQDKKDKERNKGTLERAWRNACYLQDSCSNRKDHFPLQRRAGPRQATGSNKTQRLLTQPFTASLKLTAKHCSNLISLSVPACPASREPGKLLKPVSSSTLPPFT